MTDSTFTADEKLSGRPASMLVLLCSFVYFTSYLTRINYGAVMAEIIQAENITKAEAGTVSTAAFLTYGVGQLISGVIGDRIRPRMLVTIGLIATAICNLLLPTAGNAVVMTLIWGANGFFQALFWPPIVKMMATSLGADAFKRAGVVVSAASSVATIAVYLVSPAVISVSGWRLVFRIGAVCAIVTAAVWLFVSPREVTRETAAPDTRITKAGADCAFPATSLPVLLALMAFAIVLQGILRDGLTTWMPTYVSEAFGLSSSASILTGIALPVFSVVCYGASSLLDRRLRNEVLSAAVMFGAGAAASAALIFFGSGAAVSVALMAVITGCMHGVNLMLISRVPAYFERYGKISTVSGLLNAFTYLGSGISGFGIALLSDNFGWKFTIISWFAAALLGMAICASCVKLWKNFIRSDI